MKITLEQRKADIEDLREMFAEERKNLIKLLRPKMTKKKQKDDLFAELLPLVENIEPAKVTEVLSNFMDACREIQRSDQDDLREKQI